LNLLSSVWQSVDKNILRTLEGANGREGTAKLLCELIVWKALEYWLMEDGTPCGQTDAEILAEFKAKVAAAEAAAKPLADSPEPQSEPVKVEPEPEPQSTCTTLPDGRIQVAFVRPNGQVRNLPIASEAALEHMLRSWRAKRRSKKLSSDASAEIFSGSIERVENWP
jgi:hypothetical protein